MISKVQNNRNLSPKLKSKLGFNQVVLTILKTSTGRLTLIVVELRHIPDFEKTDPTDELSCQGWAKYNVRKKVCVDFKTDSDKMNIVVYSYRNNLYLKNNKIDLKLTEYWKILTKQVYFLSFIDISFKKSFVLGKTTVSMWTKLHQEWTYSFYWAFHDLSPDRNCHLNTKMFTKT